MRSFVEFQFESIAKDLRFLELFTVSPTERIRRYERDLRNAQLMADVLRLPVPLPTAYKSEEGDLMELPEHSVLHAIDKVRKTIDLLESLEESQLPSQPPLQWLTRVRETLSDKERHIVSAVRAKAALGVAGLYVIVGPDAVRGRPVIDVAEDALRGGASVLQLRDKTGERGHVLDAARTLRELCNEHGALFFVNDDSSIAVSSGAHGVHLGQSDLPVQEARGILARTQLIGRSNNTTAELADSLSLEVDYVAVGAVFRTTTVGKGGRPAIGLDGVRSARERTSKPIVAIGGIDARNAAEVVAAGADCVAVISAVTMADDPRAAAARLVDEIESARRSP